MTKSQTFTAKTVDDAKALAAKTWGVPVSIITFEVLEEPKRGLFGVFGKGEAKVKATYTSTEKVEPVAKVQESVAPVVEKVAEPVVEEVPAVAESVVEEAPAVTEPVVEEAPAVAESIVEEVPAVAESVVEEAPAVAESIVEEAPAVAESVVEEAPAVAEPVVSEPEETVAEAAEIIEEAVEQVEEVIETAVEAVVEEETIQAKDSLALAHADKVQDDEELISGEPSATSLEKIEKAKAYLSGILEKMGVKAELQVTAGAESALIEIVSPNSGAIIGKRGETLDALQYLTFMIANRGDKEYYRVILNSANYRERRRKTLEELARKIAKNVLRSGRSTTLEPMNPYERRIIHSAIAEIEGVNSKSIGEEPYRKVVISSNNAKPPRKRNNRRGHDGDGRRDNRGDRRRNHHGHHERRRDDNIQPERISMDSMKTSFEKDYKRPKAEDEINAGLYGKIEF